jgi:outer membrane immunogenic protein
MLKTSLAAASFLAFATTASAADLPRKSVAPVFAATPAFTWTGFYVGVNAGYTWAADKNAAIGAGLDPSGILPANFALGRLPSSIALEAKGFLGGVQIGYNWQMPGSAFVLGVETDIQYSGAKKNATFRNVAAGTVYDASTKLEYFGTLRARLGFAVMPQFLIYATGGLAYGQVKDSGSGGFPGAGQFVTFSSSKTRVGYALGGGAEYALTRNVSVKAEYLYYDLGKTSGQTTPFTNYAPPTTLAVERKNTGHIARAGVNYRF